jgi:hypothetical protein
LDFFVDFFWIFFWIFLDFFLDFGIFWVSRIGSALKHAKGSLSRRP